MNDLICLRSVKRYICLEKVDSISQKSSFLTSNKQQQQRIKIYRHIFSARMRLQRQHIPYTLPFSEFLRSERMALSSHAETENMERRRVVNRHVVPRTSVSSFLEVSEGAGNAGLPREPWM